MPFLKYETALIRPKIMVCLGRIAARKVIAPGFRISREHGTWIERKGFFLTAVYHPSALLRDPSKVEETRRDSQEIKRKLEELSQ